jgi:hypothetical protein
VIDSPARSVGFQIGGRTETMFPACVYVAPHRFVIVPGLANVHSSNQFVSGCVEVFCSVTHDWYPPGHEPTKEYWTRQIEGELVVLVVDVVVLLGGGQAPPSGGDVGDEPV